MGRHTLYMDLPHRHWGSRHQLLELILQPLGPTLLVLVPLLLGPTPLDLVPLPLEPTHQGLELTQQGSEFLDLEQPVQGLFLVPSVANTNLDLFFDFQMEFLRNKISNLKK